MHVVNARIGQQCVPAVQAPPSATAVVQDGECAQPRRAARTARRQQLEALDILWWPEVDGMRLRGGGLVLRSKRGSGAAGAVGR